MGDGSVGDGVYMYTDVPATKSVDLGGSRVFNTVLRIMMLEAHWHRGSFAHATPWLASGYHYAFSRLYKMDVPLCVVLTTTAMIRWRFIHGA
jgi:hypothetical protein